MKRLSILASSILLAASANAATVSFNYSYPLQTTEITQTGNLGLFDLSLGTLTGASIVVNGAAAMSFSGTNTATQAQNATLTASTELFWSASLSALNSFLTDSILLLATSGSQSYAAGETKSFGPFTLNGSKTDDLSAILGSLQAIGGGTFGVTCNSASGMSIQGGGGNIGSSQSTTAGCGASIEYTYDPQVTHVPEPTSLALVGLALAGLGGFSRRRKAV